MDGSNAAKTATRMSCMTCSKAKVKCVRSVGAHVCERCARLKKECHVREPVLRPRKVSKPTRAAQLENLESKIEHLVNALSSAPQLAARRPSEYGQHSPAVFQLSNQTLSGKSPNGGHEIPSDPRVDNRSTALPQVHSQDLAHGQHQPRTPAIALNAVPVAPEPTKVVLIDVTLEEAEGLLHRYQQLLSPGLPFVVVPSDTSAQSLSVQRPVLLRAISTVALFHDLPRQQTLVKDLIRDVGERMFVEGEKSIDLLQGIVVLVGWFHPHIFWCQQLTNLVHLGMSLVIDLGLDRVLPQCQQQDGNGKAPRILTLAEHRAHLGLFYYTSMLSSCFKKMDAMPFSMDMQQCLEIVETTSDLESDVFLAQMVRIQRTIESILAIESPRAPARLYVKAFKVDIARLREADRCSEENIFLHMQYLIADMHIAELALIDLAESSGASLSGRLGDLHHCVEALKALFDAFFTIPSSVYLLLPFSLFGQFAHGLIVWQRLAALDTEQWSLESVHDQLNFSAILDELCLRFEEPQRTAPGGIPVVNDSFNYWSKRLRWLKHAHEVKSDSTTSQVDREAEGHLRPPNGMGQPTPPDDMFSSDFFGLDDNFWSLAGDLDLGFPESVG